MQSSKMTTAPSKDVIALDAKHSHNSPLSTSPKQNAAPKNGRKVTLRTMA
jgi:hypothetical protein